MSYAIDKEIFIRDYRGRAQCATDAEAEDAWRVHYVAHRTGVFGETVEVAEARYLAAEGKPVLVPQGRKRGLPGGHPHEAVLEVAFYTSPTGTFGGALLVSGKKKAFVELVATTEDRLYRTGARAVCIIETLSSARYADQQDRLFGARRPRAPLRR